MGRYRVPEDGEAEAAAGRRTRPILDVRYDDVQAELDAALARLPIGALPSKVGMLAVLQVFEALSARAAHHQDDVAEAALELGIVPHGLPGSSDLNLGLRISLGHALVTISRGRVAPVPPGVVDGAALVAATDSFMEARHLAGPAALLDAAVMGWRDFIVDGKTVRLPLVSPERMLRRADQAMRLEAEYNANHVEASVRNTEELAFTRRLRARPADRPWDWRTDEELMPGALHHAQRATRQLYRWTLDEALAVGRERAFTVGEYRAVSEVVHAVAYLADRLTDGRVTTGNERLLRGLRDEWIGVLVRWSGVPREHVDAVLRWMTHDPADVRGRTKIPASSTPFFDLGEDELAFAVTLRIWQKPEWAVRAVWKARQPQNYGAEVARLGHDFAAEVSRVFAARGWITVTEADIIGGDIDSGTAVHDERFVIAAEAKMFLDDPLHQVEDAKVWDQLDHNVRMLRRPEEFARVFGAHGLQLGEVAGLVVIPGRAGPAIALGEDVSLLGLDDLRDLVRRSATPRALWDAIKAAETDPPALRLVTEQLALGPWTIEAEVLANDAVPAIVRAPTEAAPE